jgi:ribonucrease Y
LEIFSSDLRNMAIFCFGLGFLLIVIINFALYWVRRAQTKAEADRLIEDATEAGNEILDAAKSRANKYVEDQQDLFEKEKTLLEERIEKLEEKVNARIEVLNDKHDAHELVVREQQSDVDIYENKVLALDKKVEQKRAQRKTLTDNLTEKLLAKTEQNSLAVIQDLQTKFLSDKTIEATKSLQNIDEEYMPRAEEEAKKLLTLVINRFARAYCPERGIGYLNFESDEQKARVLGPEMQNLRVVEKLCGIDLAYDEKNNAVSVYGFDPVRRELGRATIDKLMTERQITPDRIEKIFQSNKKELFQKILKDGNRIAAELRIDGLHAEIKNMMGALRYRYSFTQNQHFHCAEVGFLCGLLAAELDVPIKDARRAGLLHDIGKAMDHSVDGGHAVIGADFIKQHGEADHIVHAVRAHHYDETPSTNLAYLVIAADAISGARPGARRSTVATYTQKIQDLQTISRGFEGVIDTHVLSAGREVRVYVDGQKIDDLKALDLSRQIALKIETEMQYPGHIRVTVVRETQAVEFAR